MDRLSLTDAYDPLSVLLLEDDADLRAGMTELVSEFGYHVEPVATIAAARERLRTLRPALVLLDLGLGERGEDGKAFLRELTDALDPQTTLVVSGAKDADRFAAEVGVLCVRKPFELEGLLGKIAEALSAPRQGPHAEVAGRDAERAAPTERREA